MAMLSSCAPTYIPNKFHAPFLQNNGDIEAEVAMNNSNGIEFGTAYALTNHLGIIVDGNLQLFKFHDSNYTRNRFIESGLGYFDNFGEKGITEVYGGFGYGNSDAWTTDEYGGPTDMRLEKISGNYFRAFLQFELGVAFGRTPETENSGIEMGLIYRPVYVSMFNYHQSDITFATGNMETNSGSSSALFHELGCFIRIMGNNLGVELQSGYSLPSSNIIFQGNFLIASIGIVYRR